MIPRTYEDWHRCITKDCGITLTRTFLLERISIFSNGTHTETQRFIQLYGDTHHRSVLAWYERALNSLA